MRGEHIVYRGALRTIEYAVLPDGRMPAKDFFDERSAKDKSRLLSLFERLGDHGRINNDQKFKKIVGTDFFEFKSFQIRVICFTLPGGRMVLTHGLVKKRDKLDRAELRRAVRIRDGCLNVLAD